MQCNVPPHTFLALAGSVLFERFLVIFNTTLACAADVVNGFRNAVTQYSLPVWHFHSQLLSDGRTAEQSWRHSWHRTTARRRHLQRFWWRHTKHDVALRPATVWRRHIRHEIKRHRLPHLYTASHAWCHVTFARLVPGSSPVQYVLFNASTCCRLPNKPRTGGW